LGGWCAGCKNHDDYEHEGGDSKRCCVWAVHTSEAN
jgi:hypothetical protein